MRWFGDQSPPIVPITINTCYPPNWISPRRAYALGQAVRRAVDAWDTDQTVAFVTSGGLSHFLVNEELDGTIVEAIRRKDHETLKSLPVRKLMSGSSEIRNWVAVTAAANDLALDWISYVPAYRSRAMTGVGLCFAHWH